MIDPFIDKLEKKMFFVRSFFLWLRCKSFKNFKIFTNVNSATVDPKSFQNQALLIEMLTACIIPPNSFALARTVEYFKIPKETLVICVGKSTYARCGIIVNVTPLEPEWEGHVTLEFSNTTPLPAKYMQMKVLLNFYFLKEIMFVIYLTQIEKVSICFKKELLFLNYNNG